MTTAHIERNKNRQINLENAIIGACLLEGEVYPSVKQLLQVQDFQKPFSKTVWQAMETLYQKQYPIDLVTVTEYLHFTRPRWKMVELLTEFTNRVSSSGNVLHWSFLLIELTFRRKAINCLKQIQGNYPSIVKEMLDELGSMESDVFEVLEAIKAYADQVGGELSKTVDSFYLEIQGRIKEIHYHHPKLRSK